MSNCKSSKHSKKVYEDGRVKKRGRKAKKRDTGKAKNMVEFNRNDHIYYGNDRKDVLDRSKKEKKPKTRNNMIYNEVKSILNVFGGVIDRSPNTTTLVTEDVPSKVLFESLLQKALPVQSSQYYHSDGNKNYSIGFEQSYSENVHKRRVVAHGENENEPPRPISEAESVQQRKHLNSMKHHADEALLRKPRTRRNKKWYYLLDDDFKGVNNGNVEFSEESNADVHEKKTFLTLDELPESTWSKSNLNYTDFEITEECLEIKTSSMRMSERTTPLCCICDTNIPPSHVFRYLMKAENPNTEFLCF